MSIKEFLDSVDTTCIPTTYTEEGQEYTSVNFSWTEKGTGFGDFCFFLRDGKLYCENECMSKEFIKHLLCKMVDDCELMDEKDENGNPEKI